MSGVAAVVDAWALLAFLRGEGVAAKMMRRHLRRAKSGGWCDEILHEIQRRFSVRRRNLGAPLTAAGPRHTTVTTASSMMNS